MAQSLNFSCEDDEALVELVAQNPPIYDSRLESYKYRVIRENIWEDIGNAMDKTGDDCKKRWKYIKDSYNRFKRKKKGGTGSGAQPKNSKWEFYERLAFLEVSSERDEINAPSPSAEESQSSAHNDTRTYDEFTNSPSSSEPPEPSSQHSSQIKRRRRQQDEFLEYMKEWDTQRQTLFKDFCGEKVEKSTDDDDLISFGEHIKSVLKKLPPILRITAKTELFSVLTKYELMATESKEGILSLTEAAIQTPSTSCLSNN